MLERGHQVSLAEQIDALPAIHNRCRTCTWYADQDEATKAAFDRYIERQNPDKPSYMPLYELCSSSGLNVAAKTFRDHINNCHRRRVAA